MGGRLVAKCPVCCCPLRSGIPLTALQSFCLQLAVLLKSRALGNYWSMQHTMFWSRGIDTLNDFNHILQPQNFRGTDNPEVLAHLRLHSFRSFAF